MREVADEGEFAVGGEDEGAEGGVGVVAGIHGGGGRGGGGCVRLRRG